MTTDPQRALPQPDAALKEQTIRDSLRLFREQSYGTKAPPVLAFGTILSHWRPFAVGALAASLALGIFFGQNEPRSSQALLYSAAEDLALMQEMKSLFGDKLEAVVRQDGRIEPVLASANSYAASQPLVITLRKGNQELRIISFSGNTVTLPFDHKKVSLSATVTREGSVIVEGKDFVWGQEKTVGVLPASIDARTLGAAL